MGLTVKYRQISFQNSIGYLIFGYKFGSFTEGGSSLGASIIVAQVVNWECVDVHVIISLQAGWPGHAVELLGKQSLGGLIITRARVR
jgi:hypothetical protein